MFINQLKESFRKDVSGEIEDSRYYPFETGMSEVVSSIRNGSLFSENKWVVIPQIETVKRDEAAILADYIKNPSPDTLLILTSDGLNRDIAKAVISAVPKERIKVFWELFENQKQNWVRQYFMNNKINPEEGVIELVLELVENNTEQLKRECEKLVLFLGDKTSLTCAEVEKYIYHSKEENVFTLFDKIACSDLTAALEVIRKISLSGDTHPIQLIGGLLWQFRRMLELNLLLDRHVSFDEACRSLRITGKKIQNIYRQACNTYRTREIEYIIALTVSIDGELRKSRGEMHSCLMDMFFYYIIIQKGQKKSRTDYRL